PYRHPPRATLLPYTTLFRSSAQWKTFPEKLEKNGIGWKVYQNEITCGGGFKGEEKAWLSNYGCNPLEYFSAFNVKYGEKYTKSLDRKSTRLNSSHVKISYAV